MRLKTYLKFSAVLLVVCGTFPLASAGKSKKKSAAATGPPAACSKKCKSGEMCIVDSGKDMCMKAKPECTKPGATPASVKNKIVTCTVPKSASKSKGKPKAPAAEQKKGEKSDIPPADPKEVEMILGGLRSIIAMYPGGQQMCPKPLPSCGTFPPLPDPAEVMEQAKKAIEHGKPEAIPPCVPLGKPGDVTTRDAMCLRYPNFCVLLPSPPGKFFAAFTEPFPCFLLTRPMFQIVEAAKAASPSSSVRVILSVVPFEFDDNVINPTEKCMWDYALCFLYACYPGMNPTVIATSILQGKISVPQGIQDKLPDVVKKAVEQAKAMRGMAPTMPSFG